MADQVCGFSGESDLYGLGIRIGIYLQWLTGLIVYVFYPEGYREASATTLVFESAVTIAIVVNSAERQAVEIFIFLYLFFGGMFIMVVLGEHSPYYGDKNDRISVMRMLLIMCLIFAGSVYSSWFWFKGLMDFFQQPPCGKAFGLVFRKVSLYNPAVYKALGGLSIICAASSGGGLIWFIIKVAKAIWRKDATMLRTPRVNTGAERTYEKGSRMDYKNKGDWQCHIDFNPLITLAIFVHSVVGIELTLYWNHISDVYTIRSIGQLIPFVIAVVELVRFSLRWMKQRKNRRNTELSVYQTDPEDVGAA